MCGIVGFCDTREGIDQSNALRSIRAMMETVRHRGPDGDGVFVDDSCCLGHLRLKIIDLSDNARQPMSTRDGSYVITFNGEIYNFRALRRDLYAEQDLRSSSDTEVLLTGYAEWGKDVFVRANGMLSAAIWDARRNSLLLARDRLGKKPLFYYWDGGGKVVFGSELKSLLVHPWVRADLDFESVAAFFTFGYVPTPRTIFKNVFKVPQGATVTFADGKRVVESYWELPTEQSDVDEDNALDEYDALLNDAVRLRLESDVPLGFFLSGGIDSSLVTALGRRIAGEIRTFSVGFRDPRYNEAPYAREVASYLRTKHTELYLDESSFADFVDVAVTYYDEPFADSSLIPTYYLSQLTRQHVTVALSGDGGDELFCGYQKYLNFRQLRPALRLPTALKHAIARTLAYVPRDTARKLSHAIQHATSSDNLVRWLVSIWKPDELSELMPGTPPNWESTQLIQTWTRFDHRDALTRLMAADVTSYLCDDILQKVDRASMAVALEIRSPLLDYRIVELAMRLPLRLKYKGGQQKYLQRRLLERYVPTKLWDRPKHGFNVPVASWYRGQRRHLIAQAIQQLGTRFEHRLVSNVMNRYMDRHLSGQVDYSQKLFALDMFNRWAQKYYAA